ncbi:4Fe-4S binding protein [Desulfovibrio ferrophilus]|uniref:Iron-sulfur binding protein n=1 Tax=Desulfovibrio ferrophilus TaxID=241368 RepID=A0A2Z6AZN4_9BACT|nr:4Fe-4S binding protein [Desulfovibrio ferrophilus]BBD08645.1 iron-sulfur binding protein [Desulfovibrio ferrophilus]
MPVLLTYLPAILSMWLLGAHALRGGQPGLMLAWALMPALFLLHRSWSHRIGQIALAAGVILWANTGSSLIQIRIALDQPWTRLALILSGLILLAVLGIILLESQRVATRTQSDTGPQWAPAWAFALCAGLLSTTQAKVSFPILLPDRFLPGSGWLLILGLSIYAAELTRSFLMPGLKPRQWSTKRIRLWGLFSAVFFVQLILGLAGAERMLMTGQLHLPIPALIMAGPLYRGEGFFMLILFLSTVALVGPAWCSWLCYIGAWDGLSSRTRKTPAPLPRWRQPVRLGLFVLVAGTAWGLRHWGAPISVALALAAGFGLGGVAIMLTLSRRKGVMVHCTTFCPIGLLANILGKLNPFRVRITEGCTGCGVCAAVCRYDALDEERIALGKPHLSCTLCGDCVGSCPHTAMHYVFPGLSNANARALFVTMAVAAHAVFLGVARL